MWVLDLAIECHLSEKGEVLGGLKELLLTHCLAAAEGGDADHRCCDCPCAPWSVRCCVSPAQLVRVCCVL